MTKTISSGLQTHLEQTVTTLAMCWKITRTDGEIFYFTTHDNDLTIEGDIYTSAYGFQQTAIQNDSSMSVDNLDVIGILDSSQIKESDLKAGKYNFADIEIFYVNYSALNQGKIKLRKGTLGEVIVTPNGIFKAELRGLTDRFTQQIVEVYTPDCRADLGDSRCKVPINPSVRASSTAYSVGDFVKVDTRSGIAWEVYENRIYECTTAGTTESFEIGFDTTVGNTTTDGTAVWTARESWTRNGIVTGVTDRRIFTVDVDEDRAVDDWFNQGVLQFDTGTNENQAMEVKDWDQSSKTITLYLEMPFDVQIGALFHIYPGCDKRLATCKTKFAITGSTDFANGNVNNFRGEPYVPGQDQIFKIPDAR